MDKKLKLGAIGIGFAWDRLHYPALQKLKDKYEIAAVCNKTIEKAQNFARSISLSEENVYSDYKKMLERTDLDVIDVLVPISENYEVGKDVIKAGKNLIAEKPFASSPQAAKELIDLKNQHNVKVMVAENFIYDDANIKIKELITQKAIGEIISFVQITGADFEKEMLQDTFAAKEWRQHPEFKGGIFLDGGIHDIARMRFLFGEAKAVYAAAKPHQKDYCPYQIINTLINFDGNLSGQYVYYSQGAELKKPPVGLRIYGTEGEIYLESKEKGTIEVSYKDGRTQQVSYTPENGYYNELLNYWGSENNGEAIKATPEEELEDIQLIYDILGSIEKKQLITK